MEDFIVFMYADATDHAAADNADAWGKYLARLGATGCFDGGSSIGPGLLLRKGHPDRVSTPDLSGYLRFRADSLLAARALLLGNPVYEAGGTVEVRELLPDA